MSKIAKQKANQWILKHKDGDVLYVQDAYIAAYDQAMQDIQEQAEKSVIEKSNGEVTIEDLVAYNQGFKTGRELALQDFLEKAEEWLEMKIICYSKQEYEELIDNFKNYMQDESEN